MLYGSQKSSLPSPFHLQADNIARGLPGYVAGWLTACTGWRPNLRHDIRLGSRGVRVPAMVTVCRLERPLHLQPPFHAPLPPPHNAPSASRSPCRSMGSLGDELRGMPSTCTKPTSTVREQADPARRCGVIGTDPCAALEQCRPRQPSGCRTSTFFTVPML
eukprot:scaffold13210_cov109-Isochrysis_galbana.AAC.7